MKQTHMKISHRVNPKLCVSLAVLWLPSLVLATEPSVHGHLETIGPFRVLRVWGTPQEMGYAHGFLLAKQIIRSTNSSIERLPPATRENYDTMVTPMVNIVDMPQRTLGELEGILQGVEAAEEGKASIKVLHRPLKLTDLILHNAEDALRAFQCSGFTVWGKQAGDYGLITTRNFDFVDLYADALNDQFILVRQPSGRRQVVTVTWPGYLGAFTGINDAGVCTFMHDGTGPKLKFPAGRYRPVAIALAELLESSNAATAHTNAEQALRKTAPYPFSYMVRVVAPRNGDAQPVRVFRIDAGGLSENPVGNGTCITTNHYLSASFAPADNAHHWSLERFQRLTQRLSGSITPQIAWKAQNTVSVSGSDGGTLHCVVVYPERKMLDLGFAHYGDNGIVSATAGKPTRITFDKLFAEHDN